LRVLLRRARPHVSVVIASYRWPEALRLSLAGALSQTVEQIEVLVVEDGVDEASRGVVEEFGDPRVRWLRRVPGSGSQAGPNKLGRRCAIAPVVAYLGQDDVWDRRHLECLLAVFSPGIDVVHAVTLCLEEPSAVPAHQSVPAAPIPIELGGGTLRLAGLSPWRPEYFVPPSSLAHRRRSRCIGDWPDPSSTGWPVDYAFLLGCRARHARFASSRAPTVFKYAAGVRPDSYKRRDVTPQRAVTAQLRLEPGLGDRLLKLGLAAGIPGDDGAPRSARPGAIADHNRRMRGLPSRFGPPVTRWEASAEVAGRGWHPPERDELGAFAWTDARTRTTVRFDAPSARARVGVRLHVRHAVVPEQLSCLRVDVDAEEVALERHLVSGRHVMTAWLERPARAEVVEVGLQTLGVVPAETVEGSVDRRVLGVAVERIELLQRSDEPGDGSVSPPSRD
jgi:hypothetical protein